MAKNRPSNKTPNATKKTHPIRFGDAEWHYNSVQAKAAGLLIPAYLVAASDAANSHLAKGKGEASTKTTKIPQSDRKRSAFRAIWFPYTDRPGRMKEAGGQSRIDALIAEARRKFE